MKKILISIIISMLLINVTMVASAAETEKFVDLGETLDGDMIKWYGTGGVASVYLGAYLDNTKIINNFLSSTNLSTSSPLTQVTSGSVTKAMNCVSFKTDWAIHTVTKVEIYNDNVLLKTIEPLTLLSTNPYNQPPANSPVVNYISYVNSIHLSWASVTRATSYEIYKDGVMQNTQAGTTYDMTGLSPGTQYSLYVKAVNSLGSTQSTATNVLTLSVPTTNPIVSYTPSDTSIILNWQTVVNATSYDIYMNGTKVGSTSNLTYSITGLTAGTQYSIYVKAVNDNGSTQSSTSSITTLTPTPVPTPTPTPTPVPTPTPFSLTSYYPSGTKIAENGTIQLTYANTLKTVSVSGTHYVSHETAGNVITIKTDGMDGDTVSITVNVTNEANTAVTTNLNYLVDKNSTEGSLNISDMTTWIQQMVDKLRESAVIMTTSILVLIALIVGAFWLIGVSKKGVRRSK